MLRVQSFNIEGQTPVGVGHPDTQDVRQSGDDRASYIAADAGFARRPPEQRLDMPAQPLVTKRSRPERETDGKWRFLAWQSCKLTPPPAK